MAEKGDFIANKKQVFELSMLPTSQSGFATEARINTELGIAFLWLRGYPFGWWLSNKSTIYLKRLMSHQPWNQYENLYLSACICG
jgi:hypothetical protein